MHEKQQQGFEAAWAVLNRCCPFTHADPLTAMLLRSRMVQYMHSSCSKGLCHLEIRRLRIAGSCRGDASDADKQMAEKELLQKIKEALPEATEPWLVQIVPQKLAEAGL